jgi:hypothetical protein
MAKTKGNSNLHSSRAGKTNEFYTEISLVEEELRHYKDFFKGKTVFVTATTPKKVIFGNILS